MCLRICILFVVGLDTAVGSAFGNLLIVCTCDFSMRLRFCNHLEEPLFHSMLNHSTVTYNVIYIDRARSLVSMILLSELSHPFLGT